jgi:hypothetical protein
MSVIAEAEQLAFQLSDSERAQLAEKLIASLPSPFLNDDEGWVEEAVRRDKEMDEHPETLMTEEEFFGSLKKFVR